MAIKKIPCGGFYVDNDAIETREGKPFLKTGGFDPIVENAKETGGFGYTESGVETILVDNERVTTVIDDETGWFFGQFTTPFAIVDGAYTVIVNGTEYNLNSTFFEENYSWYLGDISERIPDFSRYPFVVFYDGEETVLFTESAGDYDVTIKTKLGIIHKIDQKYIRGTYKNVTFEATSSGGGEYDISDYPDLIAAIMNLNSTLYADGIQMCRIINGTDIERYAPAEVNFKYLAERNYIGMTYYPSDHMLVTHTEGTDLTIQYEGTN